MKIALFGGTFDPVHVGHLRAAKAAVRKFDLDQVLFIPTGNPPHKHRDELTPFAHRFAMVALACSTDRRFVASLLEAPASNGRPHYSVVTALKAKKLFGSTADLFFLMGVDAFLDLPHWKDYQRLLSLVDFIVVSRPGFETPKMDEVVPPNLLLTNQENSRPSTIRLRHRTVNILRGVRVPVASRDIREALRKGRPVTGLVPPLVKQYILKAGLYRSRRGEGPQAR